MWDILTRPFYDAGAKYINSKKEIPEKSYK